MQMGKTRNWMGYTNTSTETLGGQEAMLAEVISTA